MKDKTEDYEPFGTEWEKELMKLPKKFIIDQYRKAAIKAALYEQEYGHLRQHLRDVIKSHEQ